MVLCPADERARAVEHLFRTHHSWLQGWVARRSRAVCADDVAAETFLKLLVLPYVQELREPRAMMATIASRIIGELRRRSVLRRALEAEMQAAPEATLADPEEALMVSEALRLVEAALAGLDPKARAAVLLSRVDGMTHREIADRLGVSTRTVERYLVFGMRAALRATDG